MKDLSPRQTAILEFISSFLDDNDYPPTIRDIQGELNISSDERRRLQPSSVGGARLHSA